MDPDKEIIFTDNEKEVGKKYIIPPNTPVGLSIVQIHHNESIFPNSKLFSPERWLDGKNRDIDRYMVSFNSGSRQCLGINLAYAELYLCLSALWRSWGSKDVRGQDDLGVLELWETAERDVEIESDKFLPIAGKGSKGVRVRVLM